VVRVSKVLVMYWVAVSGFVTTAVQGQSVIVNVVASVTVYVDEP
jgi:hypothetical protein